MKKNNSKKLNLKKWLSLEESALTISNLTEEKIVVSDLLQFVLDGSLQLSVYFPNNAYAVHGRWIGRDQIKDAIEGMPLKSIQDPTKFPNSNEMYISNDEWIAWEDDIHEISGIWDVTMKGDEYLDVKSKFESMTSGLSVKPNLVNGCGVLLQQGGIVCQLYRPFTATRSGKVIFEKKEKPDSDLYLLEQDRRSHIDSFDELIAHHYLSFNKVKEYSSVNYFTPCIHLADIDFVFVIRANEINRLMSLDKPYSSNEKNTHLLLLGAALKEAKIDWNKRGVASAVVQSVEQLGAKVNEGTVKKVLDSIDNSIESRSKN